MNVVITVPALVKTLKSFTKFNKNIPKIKALRATGDIEAEKELILRASGKWAEDLSNELRIHYDIEGEENIPESGPIMVYSNHQGLADILAIYYLFRNHFQIGFISKNEWRKVKPLATAIEYTRSLFLIRNNSREALKTIGEACELLDQGFSLAIFPEGTRSQSHEMGEMKVGSFKFAERANVPILPITLDGSYKIMEETGSYKADQTIRIRIHPLVHIENMNKTEKKGAVTNIINTIRNGLDQ